MGSEIFRVNYLSKKNMSFESDVFQAFAAAGVEYAVLRNWEELPHSFGNDLDLIVKPSDAKGYHKAVRARLESMGFFVFTVNPNPAHVKIAVFSNTSPVPLLVDVWTSINWRGMVIYSAEELISRRQVNKAGIYTVATIDALTIIFLQGLLNEKDIATLFTKYRKYAAIEVRVNEDHETFNIYGGGAHLEVGKMLNDYRSGQTSSMNRRRKRAIMYLAVDMLTKQPIKYLKYVSCVLRDLIFTKPRLICLMGPDGSGKTSVAKEMMIALDKMYAEIRYYHSRPGILPDLSRLYPKKTHIDARPQQNNRSHDKSSKRVLLRYLQIVYYSLDFALFGMASTIFMNNKTLLIYDRYYYDYYLSSYYESVPRKMIRMIEKIVLKPYHLIYLYCAPDVILSRKKELTRTQIQKQQEACEWLVSRLDLKSCKVESNSTIQSTFTEIIHTLVSK